MNQDEAFKKGRQGGGFTERQVRQLAGMLEPSPSRRGPPPGARLVFLQDVTRGPDRPGSVVAVLAKQWEQKQLTSLRGWRGPEKPTEKFGREWLKGFPFGHMLVDIGGYYDPLPIGVAVIGS